MATCQWAAVHHLSKEPWWPLHVLGSSCSLRQGNGVLWGLFNRLSWIMRQLSEKKNLLWKKPIYMEAREVRIILQPSLLFIRTVQKTMSNHAESYGENWVQEIVSDWTRICFWKAWGITDNERSHPVGVYWALAVCSTGMGYTKITLNTLQSPSSVPSSSNIRCAEDIGGGLEGQTTALLRSTEELFTRRRGKTELEGKSFSGKGKSRKSRQKWKKMAPLWKNERCGVSEE